MAVIFLWLGLFACYLVCTCELSAGASVGDDFDGDSGEASDYSVPASPFLPLQTCQSASCPVTNWAPPPQLRATGSHLPMSGKQLVRSHALLLLKK